MTDEPAPIPRVRAITGIFVETGMVLIMLLFLIPVGLALPEWSERGGAPRSSELWGTVAGLAVAVFVVTLLVAHLVVGRAGSAPTRRWVAWECLRYALLGLAGGLFMYVAITSSWLQWQGILALLATLALVPLALVAVGRLRRWRDRAYREQLLTRLAEGFVEIEGAVLDSRSSGRMTDMTTIGWWDGEGNARYARIITAGQWSRLAPVALILRSRDQSKLVHAAQQIG